MVEIDVVYEGELHTSCRHAPSERLLETDAPVDNQGRGESFSPTDLLATALASCALTTMGIVARREGCSIDGARTRIEKHMVADPQRRVGRLVARFEMPAAVAAAARTKLEEAAHGCPVRLSLHDSVQTELVFDWSA